MDSKHIERDYSAHRKSIIRPYGEYVKLEIFSFDPTLTQTYLRKNNTLKGKSNTTNTSWKSWSCFKATDMQNPMKFTIKYNVKEIGHYRIDLIYEQNDYIHSNKNKNTDKDLLGKIKIDGDEYDISFDGENNVIKRHSTFYDFTTVGNKTINIEVPHNCYFMGAIINKTIRYVGDNLYGENSSSGEGNLVLTSATVTNSNMTKPTEMTVEIFYDSDLVCEESPSGFYIDYWDEVNFYVKTDDGQIKQIFGGYVSSILPDSDLTKLSISCADRLIDGQNKYILHQMTLGGGEVDAKESEYSTSMTKDFDSYPKALKHLCDIHEVTLQSNISNQYTVDGEKFHKGIVLSYGSSKNIKKIPVTNANATSSKNYIMVRNKPSSEKKQVWTLYDASKYAKTPLEFTNYPYLHITYGLGAIKTESKPEVTEKVDNSDTVAGSQKFTKCGVSEDGKYLMAIGLPSAGKLDTKKGWTKTIFERKCPHCGSTNLVYDIDYGGSNGWGHAPCRGNTEGGGVEGHIFCKSCDADYSVQGWEHNNSKKYHLTKVSSIVSSSKAEKNKLRQGKMVAVPKTGVTVSSDDIFKAITKIAFKYSYNLSSGASTYSAMKKSGKGECCAFSDLIFTELKKYGVSCKIVDYATNMSGHHRSVLYKDEKNKWVDFPYREYGWDKKYNNMLNNTSASKSAHMVKEFKGHSIGNVKSSKSGTSSTRKTTITTTKGYDKTKPFQAYIKLTYSLTQSFKSKKYSVNIKFTQNAPSSPSINNFSLPLFWVNNTIKQTTLKKDKLTLVDYLKSIHGETSRFYLQSIQFIAPTVKATGDNKDVDWYKYDDSTNDNSSCKMNLYQIVFDDNPKISSSGLQSCGKSVNSMMEELVKQAGYYVNMTYGLHRKDDIINFRVVNQTNEQFIATEGDNNNILAWNSISYSPISSMFNMSMQVFKVENGQYKYIDTSDPESILRYGEQCTLQTKNDVMDVKEAYFNAIHSEKYNPEQTYTFSITVPNCPNVELGDLVKVVANAKKLNTIKEVNSIKIKFDTSKIPRVQTELGIGELAPDIQLTENLRRLRSQTKEEINSFSSTAQPVMDNSAYEWDN